MSSLPHLLVTVRIAVQELPDVSRISISNNSILGMCIMMMMDFVCIYVIRHEKIGLMCT